MNPTKIERFVLNTLRFGDKKDTAFFDLYGEDIKLLRLRLRRVAYHEAGHVAAYAFFFRPSLISS